MMKRTLKGIFQSLRLRYYRMFEPPIAIADYLYYLTFKHNINWQNPQDLNQWINWLSFKTDTTRWSELADKYAVRHFLTEKGFEKNLVPLLAVWESPDDIDFDILPKSFVLKANNGSGDIKIVNDKETTDQESIKDYFNRLLKKPFGLDTAEPHYLRIKPKIIAEQVLDKSKQQIPSNSIIDYKFWCIDGNPIYCLVCSDRTKENYAIELFSVENFEWKYVDDGCVYNCQHKRPEVATPCPMTLKEMVNIASKVSKGFPQMRVDFYEIDGKAYIGELTMTAASGRMTSLSPRILNHLGELCGKAVKDLGINE